MTKFRLTAADHQRLVALLDPIVYGWTDTGLDRLRQAKENGLFELLDALGWGNPESEIDATALRSFIGNEIHAFDEWIADHAESLSPAAGAGSAGTHADLRRRLDRALADRRSATRLLEVARAFA